jgi:hypothetical protein
MTQTTLRPVKTRGSLSPVLIELTIVILFFALSASVIVRLIAAAGATADESAYHARAILAMEDAAERIKADPAGGGSRAFSIQAAPDLTVDCVVTRDDSPAQGALYDIELSVVSPGGDVYYLDAARYIADAEAAP